MNNILFLLGTIISLVSVVSIYDARSIAIKFFAKDETNEAVKILKIVGTIILIIGLYICYIAK